MALSFVAPSDTTEKKPQYKCTTTIHRVYNGSKKILNVYEECIRMYKNVYEVFRTTMRPNFYVLEYLHHTLATLVAPSTDGTATCLVSYKARLVL